MDLLDALSSNSRARSVVELSLESCFQREHTSVFKAIAAYAPKEMSKSLAQLASPHLSCPQDRSFWALGVDTTPAPRPYAQTLQDRGYVYQPALLQSNKPVTIGHCYSEVALLPEPKVQQGCAWVVPLSCERVGSMEDKELAGALQINLLLDDPALPFHDQLCVEVGDTSYSKPKYLFANRPKSNLVSLVRVRGTRTFYRKASPSQRKRSSGHPAWYGAAFSLHDPQTWPAPDATVLTTMTSRRGRVYQVKIEAWQDMLTLAPHASAGVRGKRKPIYIPMHHYPFTLVRICLYNDKGLPAYPQALWVIVMGEQRNRLSLLDIFTTYHQRYDLEHFFRFGKQRLLLDSFQTPEVKHEENWWSLAHLAYLQLWVARPYAENHPHPWERSRPSSKTPSLSPTRVQRDFGRIIRQIGTPATLPERRGYSPGRPKGTVLAHRPRLAPVYKGFT